MIQTQWIGGKYPGYVPDVPERRGITGADTIRESLKRSPGQTTLELAASTGMTQHAVSVTLDRMRVRGEALAEKKWVSRRVGGNICNLWSLA